jgi:hypothetical protein
MSRAAWYTVVFVLIMAGGAIAVHRSFREAQARPAVQRQLSELRLKQIAEAVATYRERHAAWPDTLFTLMRDANLPFGFNAVRGTGQYAYRKPAANADQHTIIVASDGFHAGVHAGEPWGGEGDIATKDVPPVAYVINAALQIEALSPDERDRRWSPSSAPASAPTAQTPPPAAQ